jgi:hypothetical protein
MFPIQLNNVWQLAALLVYPLIIFILGAVVSLRAWKKGNKKPLTVGRVFWRGCAAALAIVIGSNLGYILISHRMPDHWFLGPF